MFTVHVMWHSSSGLPRYVFGAKTGNTFASLNVT